MNLRDNLPSHPIECIIYLLLLPLALVLGLLIGLVWVGYEKLASIGSEVENG